MAAPLGRQVLFAALGVPTFELYGRCGLGNPPGTAMLVSVERGSRAEVRPQAERHNWAEVPATEARETVRGLVSIGNWQALNQVSELELLSWIAGETGSFGFRGEDEWLWGLTAMAADELVPVADLLLSCSAARHWWRPVVRDDQRILAFDSDGAFLGKDLRGAVTDATTRHKADNAARVRSRRGERKRLRDEAKGLRYGAHWWSTPTLSVRSVSAGPFEGIPSIELLDFVDSGSLSGLATVIRFSADPTATIYEVTGPEDWAALVERYPMDSTGTHDGEWRYWGGVSEPWLLPDWNKIADDYAGIHVTIGGYLASSGKAMRVGDSYTMLAGWVPDGTLWLRDISTQNVELGTWNFSRGGFHFYDDDPLAGWTPA